MSDSDISLHNNMKHSQSRARPFSAFRPEPVIHYPKSFAHGSVVGSSRQDFIARRKFIAVMAPGRLPPGAELVHADR